MEVSAQDKILQTGFRLAANITKKDATSFYFAARFLPLQKRLSAYTLYALCRLSDETVDCNQENSRRAELQKLRNRIESVYANIPLDEPLFLAFRETINSYNIPKEYFLHLIEGMQMDLDKNRYENFPQLYEYCYRAAGVVGLMMLHLFGFTDEAARKHAVDLGIAMQLTNILRDIKEDLERNRIYLPQDELKRFGVSEENLRNGVVDEKFKNLLIFQIQRCQQYFHSGEQGLPLISDRRSRIVAIIMKELYAGIVRVIEKNRYDVFSRRARVNNWEKLEIAFTALTQRNGG